MKTERKIEILENAKKIIKNFSKNREAQGLCFAVAQSLTYSECAEYDPYVSLEFLGIKKPKADAKDSEYWFETNSKGDKKRIEIINKAIKKLKEKK